MIITKIKRIASTNRYHLYADEQWQGIFLDEILAIYKLKTDQEIDEDEFAKIKKEKQKSGTNWDNHNRTCLSARDFYLNVYSKAKGTISCCLY